MKIATSVNIHTYTYTNSHTYVSKLYTTDKTPPEVAMPCTHAKCKDNSTVKLMLIGENYQIWKSCILSLVDGCAHEKKS